MYQTCVKGVLAYNRRAFLINAHHCRPEAAAGLLSTLIHPTSPGVFIQVHNHQQILHALAINPGMTVVRPLVEVKTTVRCIYQTSVKGVLAYSRKVFSNNAHHCRPEAAAGHLSTPTLPTSRGVFGQVHNRQQSPHASNFLLHPLRPRLSSQPMWLSCKSTSWQILM